MNALRPLRILVLAGLLALAGCATQQHSRDLLKVALYDYAGTIRWNRFDAAANFVDPDLLAQQPLTPLQMQRYEQLQVTGYYVKGTEQPAPGDVRQLVEIRFINRHTQAERTLLVQERWRYDESARRWWIASGLPDLTAAR